MGTSYTKEFTCSDTSGSPTVDINDFCYGQWDDAADCKVLLGVIWCYQVLLGVTRCYQVLLEVITKVSGRYR